MKHQTINLQNFLVTKKGKFLALASLLPLLLFLFLASYFKINPLYWIISSLSVVYISVVIAFQYLRLLYVQPTKKKTFIFCGIFINLVCFVFLAVMWGYFLIPVLRNEVGSEVLSSLFGLHIISFLSIVLARYGLEAIYGSSLFSQKKMKAKL